MADRTKAEKLAIARRKLKEYQKKEKDAPILGAKSNASKGPTKLGTDDAPKQLTKESFVFESGSPSSQVECQTSDDGSYCPSPEMRNNDEVYNNTSKSEANGRESMVNQLSTTKNVSSNSSTPMAFPSVADMFVTSHLGNNEAENFFNSISPSGSFGENINSYASFPLKTSNSQAQDNNYQNLQPVNGPTGLSTSFHATPSEVLNLFSSEQSNVVIGDTPTYFTAGNTSDLLSNFGGYNSIAEVPILSNFQDKIKTESVTENIMPQQALVHDNSCESFSKTMMVEESFQQQVSQLPSDEVNNSQADSKNVESASYNYSGKLATIPHIGNEEMVTRSLPLSSSESLRQMSLQINDLISETVNGSVDEKRNSTTELQHRNQELASMLSSEQQKNEQLNLQLKEYQSQISQLESELNRVCAESEARVTREIGPLQEQLQLHAQTVGILVGEKTELQSALNKSQQLAKQKAGEAEELQRHLKESRHKVTETAKEISVSNASNQQLESTVKKLTADLENLKLESKLLSKQLEETEEDKSEIQQKLNSKLSEVSSLQQQLQERQSQLSLMQLRVQQLSMSGNTELDSQIEMLNQQKISLEHQVAELQQTVRSVTAERDQASQQYQQYVQQLNSQLQNLVSKLESATAENETLLSREQSLVHHVSELEKQLQLLQQQQHQNTKIRDSSPEYSEKIERLEEKLIDLEEEKKHLSSMNDSQQQQIEELCADLNQRLKRIEDLESMIDSIKEDQPNKERLLAAIESDKVAAARAVAQNQKLKDQLEELQQGFVTMSNTKLELTEKLQHEQHVNKEKCEQVLEMETELKNIRQQLQEKEVALQQLQNILAQTEKSSVDRGNEVEIKQDEHYSTLSQELADAKALIEKLKIQNSNIVENEKIQQNQFTDQNHDLIASLSASIQQLEAERDSLLSKLQLTRQNSESGSSDGRGPLSPAGNRDNASATTFVSPESQTQSELTTFPNQPEKMKEAMEKLQEKFKKTMEEIADLSEEKQRLEHLVLQLQGETETIGEYITLYQVQRSILRQRAKENDEQLARVSKDREEMKMKLQQLSALVRELVPEKENAFAHFGVCTGEHTQTSDMMHEKTTVAESFPPIVNGEHTVQTEEIENPLIQEHPANKADTAEKIIALLSEIGSSNLVDPQTNESFHPCPWCSGRRLLTV